MSVEQELQTVTKIKPKAREKRQAFLDRMLDKASELEDDVWETLSPDAQAWVNDNTKGRNEDRDNYVVTEFEAEEEEEAPAPKAKRGRKAAAPEPEEAPAAPAKRGRKAAKAVEAPQDVDEEDEAPTKRRGAPAKQAAKGKGASKGNGAPQKVGAQHMIKKLLTKKPTLTSEQIAEKLSEQGYTATPLAISSIRSGWRNTVKILQDAGHATELKL